MERRHIVIYVALSGVLIVTATSIFDNGGTLMGLMFSGGLFGVAFLVLVARVKFKRWQQARSKRDYFFPDIRND